MSKTIEKEIQDLTSRVRENEVKLKRHLEIYANNGKELARLADVVESMVGMVKLNNKQTEEMYTIFSGLATTGKWTNKIVKWIFGIAISIGTLIVLSEQINK